MFQNMLDSKRRKGIVKLGTNNTELIMSHKQVKQLLERGTLSELPVTAATITDLKSLCLGLLETLGDKTLALAHQRKANKILAARINELESKLGKVFPSHVLLENYCSADADRLEVSDELVQSFQNGCSVDSDSGKSDENTTNHDLKLPPNLQELLDKAMAELKNDD